MQRRYRLRSSNDFERLRRDGRTYHSRPMFISVLPNGLDYNRYGFVASKGVGKAVIRNRVRRLMREVVRQLHPRLMSGHDIVLVARNSLVQERFHSIQRIALELFRQAGLVESDGE